MRQRGVVAMLDSLLAYTVAFVAIGMVVVLMTDTPEADMKTSYTLNVWAEDLADAIGFSMVNPSDPTEAWRSDTSDDIKEELNTSLIAIAEDKNLAILVEIDGSLLVDPIGNMTAAREIAVAKRFLFKSDDGGFTIDPNTISVLKVTIGV
jgi:ABC-type phosphate/phosphonate transport system substrate-binding protein